MVTNYAVARPRSITDEQILSSVRSYALEQGPRFSLDELASRLSVTAPALLKRFGSRQRLMLEALRPEPHVPTLAPPNDTPLCQQLEAIFESFAVSFGRTFPCLMVLRESGIPESDIWAGREKPTPKRAWIEVAQWLKAARAKGLVKAEEIDTAASAMVGAVVSRIAMSHMLKAPMTARDQRVFIKELANLFSRALQSTKEV